MFFRSQTTGQSHIRRDCPLFSWSLKSVYFYPFFPFTDELTFGSHCTNTLYLIDSVIKSLTPTSRLITLIYTPQYIISPAHMGPIKNQHFYGPPPMRHPNWRTPPPCGVRHLRVSQAGGNSTSGDGLPYFVSLWWRLDTQSRNASGKRPLVTLLIYYYLLLLRLTSVLLRIWGSEVVNHGRQGHINSHG